MIRSIIITPDGACTLTNIEPDVAAREQLATSSLDVVMARALGRDGRIYVLHIDDWGAVKELPINRKAWALYSGSPIHGIAVLSADDRGPIDDWIIQLVTDAAFPPPEIHAVMDQYLERGQ